MPPIRLQDGEADLEQPTLVEGFPGVGLVGKIATDHLIDTFEMRYYASVHCEGLPPIGVYRGGDSTIRPPVRLYVSEAHDLLALQSDAPISAQAVNTVSDCLTSWLIERDVTPIYLSGLPAEREGTPDCYGVATGNGVELLDAHDIAAPDGDGVVSGPTGALLNRAAQLDYDSIGLVVECHPQFPDPEAASTLLENAVAPLAGLEVDVSTLTDQAADIREQREQFAQRMQEMSRSESSQAQPLGMYQ